MAWQLLVSQIPTTRTVRPQWHDRWQLILQAAVKGVFIATQLNWTQLTQLNSVQPSQSCLCLWRHDLQTESTGSLRSLIGDSCLRCERVDNSTSSWVELSCVAIDTSPTQLNSTSSWVELCRYKHPLTNFARFFLEIVKFEINFSNRRILPTRGTGRHCLPNFFRVWVSVFRQRNFLWWLIFCRQLAALFREKTLT